MSIISGIYWLIKHTLSDKKSHWVRQQGTKVIKTGKKCSAISDIGYNPYTHSWISR